MTAPQPYAMHWLYAGLRLRVARAFHCIFVATMIVFPTSFAQETPAPSPSAELLSEWEKSVRPILSTHCLQCHNSINRSGKLDLETVANLVRGGLSGSAIDLEKPSSSLLLEVLTPQARIHMPPDQQLMPDEIAVVSSWLGRFEGQKIPEPWSPTNASTAKQSNQDPGDETQSPWSKLPMGINPSQVIDMAIESDWIANRITPAQITSDSAFARRLFLDLIGRIPRESELLQFIQSTDSRKRERLVDHLLASDEYATHMSEILDAVLMGRKPMGRGGKQDRSSWHEYLTSSIRNNKPWNEFAREVILARPKTPDERGATWYLYSRQNKHQDIAEAISKDFFGVRIDCAQCHDHPLASEIEQGHYWGLVAFFNRGTNVDTPNGPRIAESAIGGFSEYTNIRGKSSLNRLVFLQAKPVEETRPPKDTKEEDREELYTASVDGEPKVPLYSRRQQFVENVLEGNPLVARAMVNRMWGWMMGRGIVHPVDALDSFHAASHPGLLDWLARDFEHSNFDVKRLLKKIALSQTYQLESKPMGATDPKWFSSAIAKPLTAESLYRSFQIALDVADPSEWESPKQKNAFAMLFPDVLTEESLANVAQGLWLTNGEPLQKMISPNHSRLVQQLLQMDNSEQLVDQLFQRIVGRSPDAEERTHCVLFLGNSHEHRATRIESLVWAMLTSAEFRFNH